MAFPTTGILDNFNRTDEDPAAGWTVDWANLANQGIKVVTNAAKASAAPPVLCNAYRSTVYSADQEVYAKLPVKQPADNDFAVACRIQNPDSASLNAYIAILTSRTATDEINLWKIVNNAWTVISGPITTTEFANGDQLGLEAISTTITVYRHNGTSWASVTSVVNADVTGSGSVGMLMNDTGAGAWLDDFGGGAVSAGGTIATGLMLIGLG